MCKWRSCVSISFSFVVDACTSLMGHLDTEGLFRKSGSVVRVKSLRVSAWPLLSFTAETVTGGIIEQRLYCFDPVGQTGPGWGLSAHCSPAGHRWTSQTVFQGASWAGSVRRPAQCFPEGPGAAHGGGEDLGHSPAVLRAARQELKHAALLLQFPEDRLSAVRCLCLSQISCYVNWCLALNSRIFSEVV